ncbi:MAG TPA: hypothetical protein DCR04_07390 [Flavobacteriales bacterium]|nr:hypothetical protein [Flavobacteriales bacterium]
MILALIAVGCSKEPEGCCDCREASSPAVQQLGVFCESTSSPDPNSGNEYLWEDLVDDLSQSGIDFGDGWDGFAATVNSGSECICD